jgi:acyl-CoA thioester hydrolase
MGVVYYANYLVYFERVRNEVLRAGGLTYKEMEASGILLPVIEAHCDYQQPAFYDDLLDIAGWFEWVSPVRMKSHCEVLRGNAILASGYTVHVVLSASSRKPIRLPAAVLASIFKAT